MGMTFYDLTPEELCDLMCGDLEEEQEDEDGESSGFQVYR